MEAQTLYHHGKSYLLTNGWFMKGGSHASNDNGIEAGGMYLS